MSVCPSAKASRTAAASSLDRRLPGTPPAASTLPSFANSPPEPEKKGRPHCQCLPLALAHAAPLELLPPGTLAHRLASEQEPCRMEKCCRSHEWSSPTSVAPV